MATPALEKINIEIGTTDSVKVSQTRTNGTVVSKHINIRDLPDLIKDSSSVTLKEKDTGYMPTNLMRDVVAQNQIRRLYYVPEYTFNFRFFTGDGLPDISSNKYNITIKYDDNLEEDILHIPNFLLRDVCSYIVNVNDTGTNIVKYNFGVLTTNMIGRVSDESGVIRLFPNHFDNDVCWGDNNTAVRDLLNNTDTYVQSNLHNHYFNSIFNTDIFPTIRFKQEVVTSYRAEILGFFNEILYGLPCNEDDFITDYLDSCDYAYLTVYFFATIKKLRPVDFLATNPQFKLGDVF